MHRPIRAEWREESLPADMVMLAAGLSPDSAFYEERVQAHAAGEVHCIGDAFQTGQVWEAVKAGYLLAISI